MYVVPIVIWRRNYFLDEWTYTNIKNVVRLFWRKSLIKAVFIWLTYTVQIVIL